MAQQAAQLLRPLAEAPKASVAARRAYVEALVRIGFEQVDTNHNEEAVRTEREAMRIAADLGARDLSNLDMGAYYAEAGAWMVDALRGLGRYDEAQRAGKDCMALADQVLERRPGYRLALHAQQVIGGSLMEVARDELDPQAALRAARREEQVSLTLLKLDPNNVVSLNNFAVAQFDLGGSLWAAGRVHEAMPYFLKQLDYMGRASVGGTNFSIIRSYVMAGVARRQAELGDTAAAAATVAAGVPFLTTLRRSQPAGSLAVRIGDAMGSLPQAAVAFARDDVLAAGRIAAEVVNELQAVTPHGGQQEFQKNFGLHFAYRAAGRAEYQLGDFVAAERSEVKALEARKTQGGEGTDDQRQMAELSTWIAMAQARQGRMSDAAQTIGPVVKFLRELAARNHGDQWLPLELARALYAEALSEPTKSAALLREAGGLIEGLAAELRPLHDVRQWRERIQHEQRGPVTHASASTVEWR